jgi:hypothetical protein
MEDKNIKNRWKRFRKILITALIAFVLIPIFAIAANYYGRGSIFYNVFGAFAVICLVIFGVGILYTTFWPCPRCGKPFSTNWFGNMPFGTCKHCGLPFGSEKN